MNIKEKVEAILKKYPYTRNDDIALTIRLWSVYYPNIVKNQVMKLESLHYLPKQQDIVRYRAIIQNVQGLFLPTNWHTASMRKMKRRVWESRIKEQAVTS